MFAMTPKQEDIAKRQRGLYLDTGLVEDRGEECEEFALSLRSRLDEFDRLGGEMVRACVRAAMGRLASDMDRHPLPRTESLAQSLGDVLAGRMMECVGRGDEHLFETYACLWHEWDEWRSRLTSDAKPSVPHATKGERAASASATTQAQRGALKYV